MSGTPLPPQSAPIYAPPSNIPVVTTPYLPGYRVVRTIGATFGLIVRSRGLGGNLMAGLRSIAGGEIKEYTQLLEQARHEAISRLAQHAQSLGANCVLSVGFDTSEMSEVMTEILAYGTAVIVEPDATPAQAVALR
jgi:uncharacterized protein YbjQ (UPF0145 family)